MIYGIDFGNLKSRVAVTRRGGVDVILNELSQRDSSSYVSYGDRERYIGEKGFDQAIRNQNNTVNNLKRFLGLKSDSPCLEYEKTFCSCKILPEDAAAKSSDVLFEVQYQGEQVKYRPQQVMAALLGRLHSFVELDSIAGGGPAVKGTDCVISCPVYYTIPQRKALLQAAEIAGIHCMALVNEPAACALDYGIFKSSTFPDYEEGKLGTVVLFVDVGHSATTISAVSFWKGSMKVIGCVYDTNLGTREIDNILLNHFRKEILTKYKIDVFENKKARFRLLQAIEKMKVMLSANPVSNLNVECLMNDIDVAFAGVKREELEAMILEKFLNPLESLCHEATRTIEGITLNQTTVEVIGGGSRMPSVKAIIGKAFGVNASVTLVATESIAKGCAILAAMLSPKFKVREYNIQDRMLFNISLGYHAQNPAKPNSISMLPTEAVNKVVPLFKKGEAYPKSLDLTFDRSGAFDLYYFYEEATAGASTEEISTRLGTNAFLLGHVTIGNIAQPSGIPANATLTGPLKVRLRFRFSLTGLIDVESAQVCQEYEVDEVDAAAANAADANATASTKKKEKRMDATREYKFCLAMPYEAVLDAKKKEEQMVFQDRLVFETLEAKNALEGYMYDTSYKVSSTGGELNAFVSPDNVKVFAQLSAEYESWLQEDGFDSTKEEYMKRLQCLKNIGEPARQRARNAEDIPAEVKSFTATIQKHMEKLSQVQKEATAPEMSSLITKEESETVQSTLNGALQWVHSAQEKYQKSAKFEDCVEFNCDAIRAKVREVETVVLAILNRPKPKPAAPAQPEQPTTQQQQEQQAQPQEANPAPQKDAVDVD